MNVDWVAFRVKNTTMGSLSLQTLFMDGCNVSAASE